MKLDIETGSNGIHGYCTVNAHDITGRDLDLLTKLLKVTDAYNKEELDNA